MTHKISILWGQCPEDGDKAKTYTFKTKAELEALDSNCRNGRLVRLGRS